MQEERRLVELEICCGDPESVVVAASSGVRRVELCGALSEGGLTPSPGLITLARGCGIPSVNALIRCRASDFLYTDNELQVMLADIRMAVDAGATGIVCGALTSQGEIDCEATGLMIEAAAGREFIFHRAFDMSADPFASLEKLISLGADRILTSGCSPNALDGSGLIRKLVERAEERIKIMAGCGVTPRNAKEIIERSRCDALHATARSKVRSGMHILNNRVSMGSKDIDEYGRMQTDASIVASLLRICSE